MDLTEYTIEEMLHDLKSTAMWFQAYVLSEKELKDKFNSVLKEIESRVIVLDTN